MGEGFFWRGNEWLPREWWRGGRISSRPSPPARGAALLLLYGGQLTANYLLNRRSTLESWSVERAEKGGKAEARMEEDASMPLVTVLNNGGRRGGGGVT